MDPLDSAPPGAPETNTDDYLSRPVHNGTLISSRYVDGGSGFDTGDDSHNIPSTNESEVLQTETPLVNRSPYPSRDRNPPNYYGVQSQPTRTVPVCNRHPPDYLGMEPYDSEE